MGVPLAFSVKRAKKNKRLDPAAVQCRKHVLVHFTRGARSAYKQAGQRSLNAFTHDSGTNQGQQLVGFPLHERFVSSRLNVQPYQRLGI